jgi:hypothetical protein
MPVSVHWRRGDDLDLTEFAPLATFVIERNLMADLGLAPANPPHDDQATKNGAFKQFCQWQIARLPHRSTNNDEKRKEMRFPPIQGVRAHLLANGRLKTGS